MEIQTQELTKINPAEYGLDEKQSLTVEQAFAPKVAEREGLRKMYEQILTKKLSAETSAEARVIRLQLVPIGTGLKKIHTTQKAVALSFGKYCDALYNAELTPVEQMKEKLFEIEKWQEIEDKKRVTILTAERTEILKQYEVDASLISVGLMTDDIWTKYLSGTELEFKKKKVAEAKAIAEKIEQDKRDVEVREAQRVENIRLKQEADALTVANKSIQDKADADKVKADEKAKKAKAISDKAIADAKKKSNILAAKLKAKADEEAKIKSDSIKADKLSKAAPDKIKLEAVAKSIDLIISMDKTTFNSIEAKKIHSDSLALLKKVSTFIREKTSQL